VVKILVETPVTLVEIPILPYNNRKMENI